MEMKFSLLYSLICILIVRVLVVNMFIMITKKDGSFNIELNIRTFVNKVTRTWFRYIVIVINWKEFSFISLSFGLKSSL